ncbi:MAG: M50 family metallopeptidase [Pseudomonadota bacterium]
MTFLKNHWQLLALTALVFALWQTPVVVPLKILVVFFHEFAHAAATWATGGTVEELSVSARQGGFVRSRGGNGFIILSAGYLGSLIIGAALLLIALKTDADRLVLGLCGLTMLLVAALYVREGFGFGFTAGTGAAMVAAAWFLSVPLCDLSLRLIGLTSLIYAPYDIFDDTIARSGLRSDAFMLAERYFGTTVFWGGLWLVLSLVVIVLCLRYALGQSSNLSFAKG